LTELPRLSLFILTRLSQLHRCKWRRTEDQ